MVKLVLDNPAARFRSVDWAFDGFAGESVGDDATFFEDVVATDWFESEHLVFE